MGVYLAFLKIITIKVQQTIMPLWLQEIRIMGDHHLTIQN